MNAAGSCDIIALARMPVPHHSSCILIFFLPRQHQQRIVNLHHHSRFTPQTLYRFNGPNTSLLGFRDLQSQMHISKSHQLLMMWCCHLQDLRSWQLISRIYQVSALLLWCTAERVKCLERCGKCDILQPPSRWRIYPNGVHSPIDFPGMLDDGGVRLEGAGSKYDTICPLIINTERMCSNFLESYPYY